MSHSLNAEAGSMIMTSDVDDENSDDDVIINMPNEKPSPSLLSGNKSKSPKIIVQNNEAGVQPSSQPPAVIPMKKGSSLDTIKSIEKADNPIKMLQLQGPYMISLWVILFVVDLLLIISTSLYLVRHDNPFGSTGVTYRAIGDIFTSVYRLMVIVLCIIFMRELLLGSPTNEEAQEMDNVYHELAGQPRTAATYTFYQKVTYFFREMELNQFTIAGVMCAAHQFYRAMLLWMAVYNEAANKWYIIAGLAKFLGAFSIPVPGICFNQFAIYKKKEHKDGLKGVYDETSTVITSKSKMIAITITIFASPVTQLLLMTGFLTELIQFCCVSVLNHDDVAKTQNIIYHCETIRCDTHPDFVVCELVFRIFVGMAIFNNLVLLGSVLSDQIHSESSLTQITKIFNPICYVFLLVFLLMDLRITDDYWVIEYHVVNWFWMAVHICGIIVVFKLLCFNLYQLNHKIQHGKDKNRMIQATKSLFIESLFLTMFAFLSTLFLSFDQQILLDFYKSSNLHVWRQWTMILYHVWQIPALYFANRIQKYDSFTSKLGEAKDYKGLRTCFVWISVVNMYDFMYSFMFEAREYDQMMNGNDIHSDEHSNIALYKWSYSFSFAVSHLLLWSLCCVIEFVVKYDEDTNQNKQIKKKKKRNPTINSYQAPPRRIRGGSANELALAMSSNNQKSKPVTSRTSTMSSLQ